MALGKSYKKWKAGETNKGKFCVVYGSLAYGPRDEILGVRYGKPACFRTSRQAKAAVRVANRDKTDLYDGGVVAKFCRRGGSGGTRCPTKTTKIVKLSSRERRRGAAARQRARAAIPF